jgi:hypothetical protein
VGEKGGTGGKGGYAITYQSGDKEEEQNGLKFVTSNVGMYILPNNIVF